MYQVSGTIIFPNRNTDKSEEGIIIQLEGR